MIERINEDLKEAMKTQDKFTLSVLRMLKSEFINQSRKGTMHELDDAEAIKVVKHQVQVRKDSIEAYTEYGRNDLVENLNKEIEVLSKYLPEEMSQEEVIKIIDEVFAELNPTSIKDMGKVMHEVSAKITNADMAMVSKIVKDRLN